MDTAAADLLDKTELIGACLRLPITIDQDRLRREVDALPDTAWEGTASRIGVHRAAGAVFLRGYAPAEGDKPIHDRPALDSMPYGRELIETALGAPPMRCVLARLPGGKRIPAHCDLGPYFSQTIRIHFPVVSHARAWMLCGGLSYVMAPGEVWALNNSALHGVWNADPVRPRTHMICDFLPTPALLELLGGGERTLGRRLEHVTEELTAVRAKRLGSAALSAV